MNALIVLEVARYGAGIEVERLTFSRGVNVIVGSPNTGKTKWLQMLDYSFGYEKRPEESFGDELARKFDCISVRIEIEGNEHLIERKWKELGNLSKVYFDGVLMNADEFFLEIMSLLRIPILHYPQGDPFGVRKWPELNLRSLLRHVYRRQNSWADIADKQPTSEQHACILQFLGIAQNLFSDDYGKLVEKQKQIFELQATKDHYIDTLQQITREILHEGEKGLTINQENIDKAIGRIEGKIKELTESRNEEIRLLVENATSSLNATVRESPTSFDTASKSLNALREELDKVRQKQTSTAERTSEIQGYRETIVAELGRLDRARFAGTTLAKLKVTHCPACDQSITFQDTDPTHCYVCGQAKSTSLSDGTKRIEFELEHLRAELEESKELLDTLQEELTANKASELALQSRIEIVQAALLPFQQAASAILPPEIALLDVQMGSLQERLQHLQRVKRAYGSRATIVEQIKNLEMEVSTLEEIVDNQTRGVRFERGAVWLAEGMNQYLKYIDSLQPGSWSQGKIRWQLRDRSFKIAVGSSLWSAKLGGTLTLYFLLAYGYSLLRLAEKPECHFPGLLILDFPPELPDGSSVADKENFLLEPFLALVSAKAEVDLQIIAVGSAFEGLDNVNRIELHKIWQ